MCRNCKGAKGRIAEANYQLCVLLFQDGLDLVLAQEYAKGAHAVMRLEGTVARATKALESEARRKHRRAVVVSSICALLAYVTCKCFESMVAVVSVDGAA